MLTGHVGTAVHDTIRAGNLVGQSQVNAQLQVSHWLSRVSHLALQIDVPASTRILGEAPSFHRPIDRAREPQAEAMPAVRDGIVHELDIRGFEGYPAEGAFLAAPLQLDLAKLATPGDILGLVRLLAGGASVRNHVLGPSSRRHLLHSLRNQGGASTDHEPGPDDPHPATVYGSTVHTV